MAVRHLSVWAGTIVAMGSRFNSDRKKAWLDHVLSMPVSAFVIEDAPKRAAGTRDITGPAEFFRGLFGPEATAYPIVYCEAYGHWDNGSAVVAPLPTEAGGGFGVFVYDQSANNHEWTQLTTGRRLDTTLRVMRRARCHESLTLLALGMADRLVTDLCDDFNYPNAGDHSLNDFADVWALDAVLASMDEEERVTCMTLLHLRVAEREQPVLARLLSRAANLRANLVYHDEVEEVIAASVQRYNGVTLTGTQVEVLRVSEPLLGYPRAEWEIVIDALVAARYQDGDLGPDFDPAPPTPDPPKGSKKGSTEQDSWKVTGHIIAA